MMQEELYFGQKKKKLHPRFAKKKMMHGGRHLIIWDYLSWKSVDLLYLGKCKGYIYL